MAKRRNTKQKRERPDLAGPDERDDAKPVDDGFDGYAQTSGMQPPLDRFEQIQQWFRRARDKTFKWRTEARECYDFVAGRQWSQEDAAKLQLENRPCVTFNRTGSVVDSVAGLEITNRQEVRFIPRQLGASGVNELLTDAGKWVRDGCNAEDEESDAFLDLVTCGIGVTETRLDYDEEPDGKLIIDRVDPLEMYWDSSATKRNLNDARHVFRVKQVGIEQAQEMFPDINPNDLDAVWAKDIEGDVSNPHDATLAPYYRIDQSPDIDKRTALITLVEVQWWEHVTKWRVVDPASGKAVILEEDDYKKFSKRAKQLGVNVIAAPMKTRRYQRAIMGNRILKTWDGPEKGGFTYKFMTGKRDRNKGYFYGLVRAMIDPQKWANKWLAQVMHIINSNAKGGVMAEADAFENPQEAETLWSDPSSIVTVTEGALRDGKIQPKPQVAFPAGIDHLMQFAISSIRDVSGVNVELLGMANKNQPGVLEQQRKQAGMTILAGLFDSLREYRKDQGKLMLYYILNYLSDGRLIRIGGQSDAKYVPLVHQDGVVEYDVIVDDTPSSPNMKEQAWAALTQMMPFLGKLPLPPQVWLEVLKYSPLPTAMVADVTKIIDEQSQKQQQQPPSPEVIRAQAEVQKAQIGMQTAQIKGQADMAKAQADIMASQGQGQQMQADSFAKYAQGYKAMAEAQVITQGQELEAMQILMQGLDQAHSRQMSERQQSFTEENTQETT